MRSTTATARYRWHAWLLGTPFGKRVAPPAAKGESRPSDLRGAWSSFDAMLDDAIAGSIEIVNAAGAVLEAGDRDADAARSALARLLPAGTIDPQSTALELARPVEISLRAA